MDDKTRQFAWRALIIAGVIVGSIAGLFAVFVYINALWQGRATIPDGIESAITIFLVTAISAATAWVATRGNRRDVNAARDDIKRTMRDGGGDAIAAKVKSAVEPMIREGDRRRASDPNDTGDRRRASDPSFIDVDDVERWR